MVVCFHNPNEENGYLSNWYPCEFTLYGIRFSSMEQYMMYRKAVRFGDGQIAARILETEDVSLIKALGRSVSNYSENLWNGIRQIVVYEADRNGSVHVLRCEGSAVCDHLVVLLEIVFVLASDRNVAANIVVSHNLCSDRDRRRNVLDIVHFLDFG